MKVFRTYEKDVKTFKVRDRIVIPLAEMGEFTATAQQVTDDGTWFMFDDYIAQRPMNKRNTNKGGYEKSDLKDWIDTVLYMAFPDVLRDRVTNLAVPSVGQMFGHDDEWNGQYFEPDTDEQFPLMKEHINRVAFPYWEWGWLKNAVKREISASAFAVVFNNGNSNYSGASTSNGVRPVFLLTK